MSTFLNWVYAQANKVYDWFGNTYYTLKNAAANAWNWAVSKAQEAYFNAIDWAYSQVQAARVYVIGLINHAQTILTDITNGIKDDLLGLFDWVEYKFNTLGDFTRSLIQGALSGFQGFIESVRLELINVISGSLEWINTQLTTLNNWINPIREKLFEIITVFTSSRIQSIINFLDSGLNTFLILINNPVVFILDLLEDKIVSYLCYVLAWALGTTSQDLPTFKTWRK